MSIDYEILRGEPPPLPDGVELRVYSMEYCPFAERARIALAYKGLKHDIINCDLANKPEFLLKSSTNAQVPVLLHKGAKIYESEVIVDYLDHAFPETPAIFSKDPLQRALGRCLTANQSSKVIPLFYKVLFAKRKGTDLKSAIVDLETGLQTWVEGPLAASDGPFFLGKEPTAVDFLIWPWMHRLETLNKLNDEIKANLKLGEKFPNLTTWLEKLHELPAVKETLVKEEHMAAIFAAYNADVKPLPYNLGSKHPFYSGAAA